jgi:uncharacterized damage-inducible protein DinB
MQETMHARLAETMSFLEDKRNELLESFADVPADRLSRRAGADGWSVAEILEHLRMVEAGIARLISKRAGQARAAGLSGEKSTESVFASFDQLATRLDTPVMQAPVSVQPRANVDLSEALTGLETSREALRVAVAEANGLSLGEIKHTHPILGELDLYQWLIFIGQHEVRHRKQIERTLKSIP